MPDHRIVCGRAGAPRGAEKADTIAQEARLGLYLCRARVILSKIFPGSAAYGSHDRQGKRDRPVFPKTLLAPLRPALLPTLLLTLPLILGISPPPQAGATTPAAPVANLCEIPFTEAHRAAIEHRHLPLLQGLVDRWTIETPRGTRIGDPYYRLSSRTPEELDFLMGRIRTESTAIGPKISADLPPRHGPANDPFTIKALKEPPIMMLEGQEKAAFDEAMQALLHWSCWTTDTKVMLTATWLVLDARHDSIGSGRLEVLTYEDWRQLAEIAAQQMRAFPIGTYDQAWDITALNNSLQSIHHNPDWWSNPTQARFLQQFHLDTTTWLFASDMLLFNKFAFLEDSFPHEIDSPSTPRVLALALSTLVAAIAPSNDERLSPARVYDLTAAMAQAAIAARDERMARSMLFVLERQLRSDMESDDRPFLIDGERSAYREASRRMDQRFGPA